MGFYALIPYKINISNKILRVILNLNYNEENLFRTRNKSL